jgi:FAD:protein FMN transferase
MHTFTGHFMNTDFYIEISNSNASDWKAEIEAWLTYTDREWSRFPDDNELAKINNLPKGEAVKVPAPLYDVLRQANDYYQLTDGLFSPYLKQQMEQNGYSASFPFSDSSSPAKSINKFLLSREPILFLAERVIIKNTSEKIDLGGFAKGYVIESAANWLKQIGGARYGLVDGGGDMTMWSDGIKKWKIGIAHPFHADREIASLTLENGAVATSNRVYRSWGSGNEKKHHLLNGKTGEPVTTDVLQATAVTRHLLDGEVAAKMCFLLPEQERNNWFKQHIPDCYQYILREKE